MRTADDQWDITSSVGATALAVAAGRALETRRADRLVDDPYAQRFVDAAGTLSAVPRDPGDAADPWVVQAGYQGVRSRFFDEALTGARTTQVVLLAAGLDARALRLPPRHARARSHQSGDKLARPPRRWRLRPRPRRPRHGLLSPA